MTHLEQLLTPHHGLGRALGATHSFDVCSEEEVSRGGLCMPAEVPQLKCLAVIRSSVISCSLKLWPGISDGW